ncbi:hypothetical protein EPI10_000302 [Gossypium australe]|uniref:Retrotransposon gag domain-containing protein n=1 Tax=Gossypium australe TaxID=47621 RepID=A0A5B6V7V1_9ROSI|nr:hypothetical protein EPI10_000302 [Gossypium australe]
MRDQIQESQRRMISQLTQPYAPLGFTLVNVQTQLDTYPRRVPVTIRPQQYQAGTSAPVNCPTGSGSNPEDNPTNPVVPNLDNMAKMDRARVELPKELEDRCKWLEEKFRDMENADYLCGVDAKDLSLVSDLVLQLKFKTLEFEKYNGTSCLEAHITMFYRRMTRYVNNDQLLIYCFQDSLIGLAAKWYNQLSHAKINSWKDLAQAFMKQYNHVTNMTPDRITLQNMEKKQSESFKWREVATQVQLSFLGKETTILFIYTLKAPFINHMLGSATKSFSDIVMSGEMIENGVRSGKIDAGENAKRSAPRNKENEVNTANVYNKSYSKSTTMSQPRTVTVSYQGSLRPEHTSRPNARKLQFTPISMTYRNLFDTHVVSPFYLKPMQPPFPKWYDANAQYKYHTGITGHLIENCTAFKRLIKRFIKMGIVRFNDPSGPNVVGNPLPSHSYQGVNMIIKSRGRKTKTDVAKVKTPLKWVLKKMIDVGLIIQDSEKVPKGMRTYYEFHTKEGHEIQVCTEFKGLVQILMDNKELEFFEDVKGSEGGDICALEERSTKKVHKVNHSVVIISRPRNNEVET